MAAVLQPWQILMATVVLQRIEHAPRTFNRLILRLLRWEFPGSVGAYHARSPTDSPTETVA